MGDSESFTSLMDLVNSHLSKTSLNTSQSGDDGSSTFPLASVRIPTGMSQTVFTPPNGIMSIPRLGAQDNEINGILAQQVTNMLIAKEKKRLEEIEQLKSQEQAEDDYVIDLISSIVIPESDQNLTQSLPRRHNTSNSLGEGKACSNQSLKRLMKPKDTLPLNQDMSYMLFRKVKKGKPSAFCKVISSRVKPVAAPYIKLTMDNPKIRRFDFSTQSPCDINLEKRRNPPKYQYAHMNMVEIYMAQTNYEAGVQ